MTENAMIDRIDEYKSRRKKRKLRRIAFALFFTGFAVLLSWFFESQVTTTVIIATHAELETDLSSNSGLSSQGMERANSLASTLSTVDVVSGLDAIYATSYRATQETAEPISRLLDLPINPDKPVSSFGILKKIMKIKTRLILNQMIFNIIKFNLQFQKLL